MSGEHAEDESPAIDIINMESKSIIDYILIQLEERFSCINNISEEFSFLSEEEISSMTNEELESKAISLAPNYPEINKEQFVIELKCFKQQFKNFIDNRNENNIFHMDILNILSKGELQNIYTNIELAIRLFLTMPKQQLLQPKEALVSCT